MNQITPSSEAINDAFRKFYDSLAPEIRFCMNGRLERGLQIVQSGGVIPYDSTTMARFKVNSSVPSNLPYQVDIMARSCTCPDHAKGHYCKHRIAAQIYRLACAQMPPQVAKVPETPSIQPCKQGQAVIWGCISINGEKIGVELLSIENDMIWIQALPVVNKDGKLEPQFPFEDGRCNQQVKASELEHIHIYENI
jgi:hypothetical protein